MDETEKTLDSLPLDILLDIFLRLSVESLARLTLSSNFFADFITNNLVYSHFKRAIPTVVAVIHSQKKIASKCERLNNKAVLSKFRNMKFSNPFYLGETFALAGSYNGLVCFYQCSKKQPEPDEYQPKYNRRNIWEHPLLNEIAEETNEYCNLIYIWNPALHQIRALSKLIDADDFVAFGYDPNNQDYKILWISSGKRNKAEVYSWKKNSWKKICKNFRYVPNDSKDKYIVDFDGSLHWVSRINKSDVRVVSAFNIADERLGIYRVPQCIPSQNCNMLGVFRGSLSLLVKHYMSWVIWSLDKSGVGCSWTKTYEFHVQPGVDLYDYEDDGDIIIAHEKYIYGLTASGKIIVSSQGREYDLVDPDTINCETLRPQYSSGSYFFIEYVESLISVYPRKKKKKLYSFLIP